MGGLWGDDTSTSTRAAAAAGSGVTPDMTAAGQTEAVGELYNKGIASLNSQEYKTAIKHFSEVERQYPYSALATKAILMQAFSFYQRNAFDDAINAANRFITLHPGDVISTGSPAGVGSARNPPIYMKPGDVEACTIEGIGRVSSRFHTMRRKNSQADQASSTPAPAASAPPVSMSIAMVSPRPCRRIVLTGRLSITPPSTWT